MAEPLLDDDGNPSDVAETLLDADSEIASTVIDVSSDNEDDEFVLQGHAAFQEKFGFGQFLFAWEPYHLAVTETWCGPTVAH